MVNEVKVEHVLMFVVVIFLLYHLMDCNGDGFNVGGANCTGTISDECNTFFDCGDNYILDNSRYYQCKGDIIGFCEVGENCTISPPPTPPPPPPPPVVEHCSLLTDKVNCKKSQAKGDRATCIWGGQQDFGRRSYNAPEVCFENSCRYALENLNCANAKNEPGGTPGPSDKNCNLCAGNNQDVLKKAGCGKQGITDYCNSSQ